MSNRTEWLPVQRHQFRAGFRSLDRRSEVAWFEAALVKESNGVGKFGQQQRCRHLADERHDYAGEQNSGR